MHDQSFKNLILDYPRQALEFFGRRRGGERPCRSPHRTHPARALMERLGERFRELDTPLLVEWPDGRREAILFVVEEETGPAVSPSTASPTTASISLNSWKPSASSRSSSSCAAVSAANRAGRSGCRSALSGGDVVYPAVALFHCEQSVEKALKAYQAGGSRPSRAVAGALSAARPTAR